MLVQVQSTLEVAVTLGVKVNAGSPLGQLVFAAVTVMAPFAAAYAHEATYFELAGGVKPEDASDGAKVRLLDR